LANVASRGRGGSNQSHGGRGRGGSRGRGGRSSNNSTGTSRQGGSGNKYAEKPTCQICGKVGHTAQRCWYRYDDDEEYQQQGKTAGAASTSYGIDTNWYIDSGSSDHITGDLEKLTVHNKYKGKDQVHGADGKDMSIRNIVHSVIHTPCKDLSLKNILHVPCAKKNLLSIQRLAFANKAFLEFHPHSFFIKDQATKEILHHGRCKNSLYPLELPRTISSKEVLGVTKPSSVQWHSRLGHPSFSIVEHVIRNILVKLEKI